MNKIQSLIERAGTDTSGKWISLDNAQELAIMIVAECYIAVENTNTSHVYTTFDEAQVKETIRRSKEAIANHFGI